MMCSLCVPVNDHVGKCKPNDFCVNNKVHCEEGRALWEQQMSESTLENVEMVYQ